MKNGDIIERNIEGIWFEAVIEEIDNKRKVVYLKYLDDGNREDSVPFTEIRDKPFQSISDHKDTNNTKVKYDNKEDKVHKDHLLKPLAGLVDDDSNERRAHRPTVIVHDSSDTDKTEGSIIINGSEAKLAAGGGLRALRYLKH